MKTLADRESLLHYIRTELGFGTDGPIDGADAVESVSIIYDQLVSELENINP